MTHAYYTIVNKTVLIDGRAVIPTAMMSQILEALHRSMRARVKDAMFWPRKNSNIQDECETCRQTATRPRTVCPSSLCPG